MHRILQELASRPLDRLIKFDSAHQMIESLVAQRQAFLSAGACFAQSRYKSGEFLVNRRVLGLELKRLLEIDLGVFEAPGLAGGTGPLQDALRRVRAPVSA